MSVDGSRAPATEPPVEAKPRPVNPNKLALLSPEDVEAVLNAARDRALADTVTALDPPGHPGRLQ